MCHLTFREPCIDFDRIIEPFSKVVVAHAGSSLLVTPTRPLALRTKASGALFDRKSTRRCRSITTAKIRNGREGILVYGEQSEPFLSTERREARTK